MIWPVHAQTTPSDYCKHLDDMLQRSQVRNFGTHQPDNLFNAGFVQTGQASDTVPPVIDVDQIINSNEFDLTY